MNVRLVQTPNSRRDGALDSTLLAHAWGEVLVRRLSKGASKQWLAALEGWADFAALQMVVRQGDNLKKMMEPMRWRPTPTRDAMRILATGVFRISVDSTRNALTLKHITDGAALPVQHPVLATSRDANT